ncbi:hypothetical protein LXL04_021520 [Taraxacum kok-saghyz]
MDPFSAMENFWCEMTSETLCFNDANGSVGSFEQTVTTVEAIGSEVYVPVAPLLVAPPVMPVMPELPTGIEDTLALSLGVNIHPSANYSQQIPFYAEYANTLERVDRQETQRVFSENAELRRYVAVLEAEAIHGGDGYGGAHGVVVLVLTVVVVLVVVVLMVVMLFVVVAEMFFMIVLVLLLNFA